MAFPIRSLGELSQSVRGAIRQYLPGTDASLKQNVLYVIAKVMALLAHEYELRLGWIFRQLFLSTATSDAIVRMHAADYGIYQKSAAPAAGDIVGTGAPHATYPAGVRFMSAGNVYATTASFTANAVGAFTAPVRAERAGFASNRDEGAALTLVDPALYPTIEADAAVGAGGLGGGADTEDMEAQRRRALARKRQTPQGGALADYERWALDLPGVVAAWARQFANGYGTVGVWVLFEDRPDGIPTLADLAAVEADIEARRLVRARFHAAAPVPESVDLTIALVPDTAVNRAAVTGALVAFFDARLAGSRIRPGLPEDVFELPRAWISEAISVVPGEFSHSLVEPAQDRAFQPGQMPVLGTIDWA